MQFALIEKINADTMNIQIAHLPQKRDYYLQSLIEHLETLLNTRKNTLLKVPGTHLFNYGLPDLNHFNPKANVDKQELQRCIARAIMDYEPRLAQVKVSLLEANDPFQPSLHFAIEAVTQLENEELLFYFEFDPILNKLQYKENF